jgi:hypothetical protein
MEVPIFVRVFDDMHSFAHFGNLFSMSNLSFPLSNYTVSYQLMKNVGFWDTCADAIGEDMHNISKCFYKTGGKLETRVIHTAFNQVNVCTGNGFISDMKAKYTQASRHMEGVADMAYGLKRFVENIYCFRQWILTYNLLEAHIIQLTLSFIIVSVWLQNFVYARFMILEPRQIGDNLN